MKKVFVISAILLGTTILILVIYNFIFLQNKSVQKANQPLKQDIQTEKIVANNTEKKQSRILAVSKDPVLGAVVDKKTEKIFYYSALTGMIWQIDGDGSNEIQVTNTKVPGLLNVEWSPDRTKVLTNLTRDEKNVFFVYDNVIKSGVQLKEGLDSATWDGLGIKIIYKYYDSKTKKRSLNIADADGKNWSTLVADIPFRSLSIETIPLSSAVSFWNTPNSSEESVLQTISLTGGEPKVILKGKFGGDYLWSPDGSQALVSSITNKDSSNITLGLVDLQGQYRDLGIPTIVSKCAWSVDGKTIYYALPGGIPAGSNMPNDYQNKKFTTQDTFWKINILTGSKDRILELSDINEAYDILNPFLSLTENSLFFTNRIDGKLYRISL